MLKLLIFLLLINVSASEIKDFSMPNYSTAVSRVIIDYIKNFFLNVTNTVNFYQMSLENNLNVNFDIMNEVLYNVKTKTVVQVDSFEDSKISIVKHYVNIIFFDCFESFEKIYKKMTLKKFDYQGFFLIIITTHMNDIYKTMHRIFDALWVHHIINANIIFMPEENNNEALIYTFFPYSRFYCENVVPLQLNHYRGQKWINKINYFPHKLQNFYGCTLRVATFPNPPFMIINQDKITGQVSVDGLDGTMIRVLSQHFNFNVQLSLPAELWGDIYENGTTTGAIKMVINEEVNMTLGFFATNPSRDAVMKSGYVYYTTNLVWIVPPGKPQTSLQKLLNPLDTNFWILSSITILIGLLAIAILKKQKKIVQNFVFGTSMQSPGMNLINIIFGGSLHHLPKRNFARFLMGLFLFFTFILRSCYTGGLVKFMQMDTRGKRVLSTAEMLEHNFTFYMYPSSRSYFLEMPQILERTKFVTASEFNSKLKQLTVDPYYDAAFITSIGHLAYRNLLVFPHRFHHHAPEALYTLNIVIYMHKESCLALPFNSAITNLVNGGLVSKWASKWINGKYLKEIVDESPDPLSMMQLEGCFQLLYVGLIMSSFIFIMEVFVSHKKGIKLKISKNIKTIKINLRKYFSN
ncbi:hypothetical protein PVAND_005413 [Polypedilum vanderplanki]|uniref:Ionotropic receptor n=1 Tax=Polypedilum vanderplanki TaxID=319348 RepID=A0A9J6C0Z3_POLVA|nr:hypothetical protein PVAND_005413 [Polypedilum vanderplanki]